MKPIATDNYDFGRLITDGYAYIDKTDLFKGLKIEKKKRNIDEPVIELL